MSRRAWLQGAGCHLLGAAGLWSGGLTAAVAQSQPPAAAAPVPFDWPELSLLDGSVLAPSTWRGTGAVLVFWATHCPFCRRHNQHVEKLHRALQGQPVRVLGLSSDRDPAVVRRYLQQQGLSFPVSMQSEEMRQRLGLRRTLPTTLTIDRRGRPGLAIPGEMFEDDVLGLAELAMAG